MSNSCAKILSLLLAFMAACFASQLHAQRRPDPDSPDNLRREIEDLKGRLEELETRAARNEVEDRDILRSLRVFGDIGFRFQNINTTGPGGKAIGGVNESRFEGIVRFGVTGYFMDTDKHRLRYEVRLATRPMGDFTAPLGAPTVGWRPVDAFGTGSPLVLDRAFLSHVYKGWLRIAGGRFQSPFHGTQLVFDQDLALTGMHGMFDLGRFANIYDSSDFRTWRDYDPPVKTGISRIHLLMAGYAFSDDQYGMPNPQGGGTPHGASLQVATKFRVRGTDTSATVVLGWHWFEQMQSVAQNISTGGTFQTTNTVNAGGIVDTKFRLGELYADLVLLEHQSASLKMFVHTVHNFGVSDGFAQFRDDATAMTVGIEWGTLEFEEALTFLLRYHYSHIEPNAVVPEFNHDVLSSNYKGHFLGIQYVLVKDLIPFMDFFYGTRVNNDVAGVGATAAGTHGSPSDAWQFRLRMGILLHF